MGGYWPGSAPVPSWGPAALGTLSAVLLVPGCSHYWSPRSRTLLSTVLFSTGVWVSGVLICRQTLKMLLSYHGWMFEPHGKTSRTTKIWAVSLRKRSRLGLATVWEGVAHPGFLSRGPPWKLGLPQSLASHTLLPVLCVKSSSQTHGVDLDWGHSVHEEGAQAFLCTLLLT